MSVLKTAASGRAARWGLVAVLLALPAWLLATQSGLATALFLAEQATRGRLSFGESSGRLSETFSVRDIVYASDGVTVRIGRASLNLRLTRLLIGRVQAETLEVETLVVATRARADAPHDERRPLTVRTPLRLAVEQGVLRDFRFEHDGVAAWALPEARFAARWRDEWFVIAQLQAHTQEAGDVALRGRFAIRDDRLHFADFDAHSAFGDAHLEGAAGLGEAPSDLRVAWTDLQPPGAAAFHSAQGEAALTGPWQDYRWSVAGRFVAADTPGTLRARGRGSPAGLTVEQSRLEALDGDAQAQGRIDWRGGLRADLTLQWHGINPGLRFAGYPGTLTGAGQLRGDWRGETPRLEFHASLRDSQLRGYPLTLQVKGVTERQQVVLDELLMKSGVSALKARGQLLPKFDIDANLSSPDLQSLWPGVQGHTELQARLQGTPQAPILRVQGTAGELALRGFAATHASVKARLAPQGNSELQLELQDIVAPASLRSARLTLSGTQAQHRARLDAQGETASGGFALTGSWADGVWRGQLREAGFEPGAGPGWQLEDTARLAFRAGRLSVEPLCLAGGENRACAQAQFSAGRQYIALRTQRFELKHLQGLLTEDWTITGAVSGTAAVTLMRGELHDLRADLSASAGSLASSGVRLDYGPGAFHVRQDGADLRVRLRLTPAGGTVEGDLVLGPAPALLDRPLRGDFNVDLPDLSWLPVLSPEIAGADGVLRGALRAGGTLRQPALDGRIALVGGRVQLATPGIAFRDIAASFESSPRAALALTVSARAGDGSLKLEGELVQLRPHLTGAFRLTGDNAQLFNTAEIRAYVAPDLKLVMGDGAARLTGDLNVSGALITPRQIGGGGIAPSGDQVLVGAAEAGGAGLAISTEVRIVLGEAVRFDGLGLKTRLTGAITAYDEPGRPTRARGEFQLVGGRYKAYGQDLLIESGRLIFTGGPVTDPAIDINAYREPREDIKVGLRARGTLDAPQFSLYSTPAMSQEEQLSWLILGRSLDESLAGGAGGEIAGAAASLGLSGGQFLAERIGTRLGFDEVTVGARPGEAAEKARFTIGKYLSPKLFVSYGVGLFQPGNYFRLQYDLGKGFKLSGESGVQSGGDVLYTIER